MDKIIKVSKRIFFEALLIAIIPTLTVILNRYLSFRTEVWYVGSTLTILGQYILSSLILLLITLIEKDKVKELFLVSLLLNSVVFILRLFASTMPSFLSQVFNIFLPVTYIGVETVFLASIPFMQNFSTINPFYGILSIVILKFIINYFVMIPVLNILQDIHMVIVLIFISQVIPMVLFARLPFELTEYPFLEAVKRSLLDFKKYFRASLTIGSIYSIIVAVVSVFGAIASSEVLVPIILNYISVIIFVYFFVWISEYER
ncbi:hypothetical protein [Caldisericum exile]|uniref:Hypothetical membrane protein n=1 Tax=Caldisericum exile (strain DSM 21853 / NBRC 104410 / AZM16c01) TaxID=511051 RepID=A0A7U6GFY1_CALEA|nr:hypothetical protein [Caldisericum exile]BAL81691.1 hypothetical membrane protein [Caldisericum exile AZM16c01]